MISKQWIYFGVIILISITTHFSGLTNYLSIENLKQNREILMKLLQEHPVLFSIIYLSVYIFVVAFSVPGATSLTFCAGFLFKQPFCTIYALIGAGTGACCMFYIVCQIFRNNFLEIVRRDPRGIQIEKALKETEDIYIYLMLIRLVPFFPFWFVNAALSIFGVDFTMFALTTFFGILPGSFLYTEAGRQLYDVIDSELNLNASFFTLEFFSKIKWNSSFILAVILLLLWLSFLLSFRKVKSYLFKRT